MQMAEFGEIERGATTATPPPRRERSDRELLQAVRDGSEQAAAALIERHWDRAYRIAYAILGDAHFAEDVTQESLVSMLGNLGRFDPRRDFEPWLHRIVANRAIDWARARSRREEITRLVAPPADAPDSDPRLLEALAALSPEHRAVVVLRHVAGYGTNEIAELLGLRRGTVGSRLRRGLDQLRRELEEDDG